MYFHSMNWTIKLLLLLFHMFQAYDRPPEVTLLIASRARMRDILDRI